MTEGQDNHKMTENIDEHSDLYGGSEAGSTGDEDRIKKLFQACDGDGDGFIDSQDLLIVCRELNLEDSLDELMRELGADDQGRISYQDFLRRRLALRPEIDALRGGGVGGGAHHRHRHRRQTPEYLPTSSDNSLGAASGGKHESWEFDSGLARDLSPEPQSLHKLMEAAGGATGNILELANKLHLAALASLKGEVLDLSSRLHSVTQERDYLEKSLNQVQIEKAHLVAVCEERVEQQAQQCEERLTELHSVIAELSRKIDRQRALVIREEEDGISETDEQDLSRDLDGSTTHLADDSELLDHDRTLGDADSSSADIDNRAVEAGHNISELSPPPHNKEMATSCHSLQLAALTEEMAHIRAENQALQDQMCQQRDELTRSRGILGALRADRDRLRKKLRDTECKARRSPEPSTQVALYAPSMQVALPPGTTMAVVPLDEMPVCKMAERVSLKKLDTHVTGSQLTTFGVWSSCVAESLVCEVRDAADMHEAGRELEAERLSARLEHARAQNTVLSMTLHEAKTQGDRLSLLLAKYESNATALRLALGYSDRAIEAYDVLVALLESELGLLLANCRAAGIGDKLSCHGEEELGGLLRRAGDNRRAAETVARHLLRRLDRTLAGNAINIWAAPWEEYATLGGRGGGGADDANAAPWGTGDERRLREHIGQLKAERSSVRSTAVELESCHVDPPTSGQPITVAEARKLDLETAVLMQEVMAMREDKSELRARLFLLEKERGTLELKLTAQDAHRSAQLAAIQHLQAQLQESERLLDELNKDRGVWDGGDCELVETLRRETRLKQRLNELATTLDQVGQHSELRHQQSADLVNHLKSANTALVQTLDRSKKKYQCRLRKLEQQMLAMVERHSQQVRTLKQRIGILEDDMSVSVPKNNTFLNQHHQLAVGGGTQSQSSGASETSL